ncbi:MAG: hypothetical protein H5T78_29215 [Nocardia sp.]|nr:hypothetical protein [Nocardia sp.]
MPVAHYGGDILAVSDVGLTEQEAIEFAKPRVAKDKYPRRVEFVTELALGSTHQVLERDLRRRFGGAA